MSDGVLVRGVALRGAAVLALILACQAAWAAPGTVVVRAGRIEPLAGPPIEGGAILIVDGRIAAIGGEVETPSGAAVLDLPGARIYPGLVNAFSQLGLTDPGSPAGGVQLRVADALYPFQEVYEHAARAGFTTLCLGSRTGGIAGQAALVRPRAASSEAMLVSDRGPLVVNYRVGAPVPDQVKGLLDGGGDEGRNLPVRWALRGEIPLVVHCASAGDVLRVLKLLEPYEKVRPVLVCWSSDVYLVAEQLGARKARVVLPAALTTRRMTRTRLNLPRILTEAGATVACIPTRDNPSGFSTLRASMAELVRGGLDRDAAVRAITSAPAEMLGLDYRLGTLEVGRDANLLILDGDILNPTANVLRVLQEGETVYDAAWGGLR